MKATVCHSYDELKAAGPGAVMYNETESRLLFVCPNAGKPGSCPGICNIPVNKESHGQKPWTMMGYPDAITLSPSVYNCAPPYQGRSGCSWHGWLQNGEWRSV